MLSQPRRKSIIKERLAVSVMVLFVLVRLGIVQLKSKKKNLNRLYLYVSIGYMRKWYRSGTYGTAYEGTDGSNLFSNK